MKTPTTSEPPRTTASRVPWIAALAVAVVLAPTLARTPQSGDGAEIVRAAVQGGVLHPPGFPLQAWLDRLIAALPGVPPALAISALGLLAHAASAGLAAACVLELGGGAIAAFTTAVAFAFFPSVWRVAVEPEVFALPGALAAATILLALRAAGRRKPRGLRESALGGLVIGLGLGAHPIFLAVLPAAWTIPAEAVLRAGARRRVHLAAFAAAVAAPPLLLYASLPLLRTASPWPDWGALASAGDVVRHALRIEYGPLSFSAAGAGDSVSALAAWWSEALRAWNVALVVAIVGVLALRRAGAARATVVVAAAGAAAGLLALARLPFQSYSAAYLEKLDGPFTLVAAILVGLGVDVLARRGPTVRRALAGLVALAAVAWLVTGWRGADAAHDRTIEIHQRALAAEISPAWVYVTEGDVETFDGVPDARARRFPIMGPELALPWYWTAVAPRLEPRVLAGEPPPVTWEDFLGRCFARGLPVASTSGAIVALDSIEPELRGLLYLARPGNRTMFTDSTIASAVRLAPFAAELPVVAPERTLSRFYARRFARAFSGSAEALRGAHRSAAAATGDSAASAILRALPAAERRARIDAFVRATGDSR